MKISLDFISDFVELPKLNPQEIGARFTISTCEVEGVEETNSHLENLTIAEITAIEPHPEADKLNLVSFKTPDGEKQVVCGAPNVKIGLRVPFAPVGTTLPGGFTLEPKKIRGILSEGMLCAEDELGLGEGHEGLLVFPDNAPIGTNLIDYMNMKRDIILDIDNKSITHRPDLWGHYGMAREFSAVFDKPLRRPFSEKWINKMRALYNNQKPPVTVKVDKNTACLGFTGISVDDIEVKPSPSWMQQRLISCGMRPINNIVDISNYVMLELGIPNHIFDRDTISEGQIIIRQNGKDSVFTTLDEMERKMIPSDTMVCDASGPSSIAGIMGGLGSSIKENTNRIFIEAANWRAEKIRHTSTRLGLRTDASQRYEKSLDSHLLEPTVLRIIELLLESCPNAKVAGPLVSDGLALSEPLVIDLKMERVNSILGTKLTADKVVKILQSLDYGVDARGAALKVSVPSFRATKDVEVDADLIEDIGRIYGYNKLKPVAPLNEVKAVSLTNAKLLERKIQDFLVFRARALEVFSYPLVGEKLLNLADWKELNTELMLANPISPETDRMRPSLVPGLLEKAALNQNTYSNFRIFELGRSYLSSAKNFSQDRHQLAIMFFNKEKSPFMDLLNTTEDLLESLSLNSRITVSNPKVKNPLVAVDWTGRHTNEFVDIHVMGGVCGFISTVHPLIARKFKIKGNLSIAVIDITDFKDRPIKDKTKYHPLPKYPGATFDCTVVANSNTPVADVLAVVKKIKLKELKDSKIVDVYSLSKTKKTITIRSWLLDLEKTLSHDFISSAEDKIVSSLEKAGYPLKQ